MNLRTLDRLLRRLTSTANPDDYTFYNMDNIEATWRPGALTRTKLTRPHKDSNTYCAATGVSATFDVTSLRMLPAEPSAGQN